MTQKTNFSKGAITGLLDKKSCKKQKKVYSKENASEYYAQNKEAIQEKPRRCYRNLSQEEKVKIKEYQRKKYQDLV